MWTKENRSKHNRDHLRYPSDLTDAEWAHVEPLIPRSATRRTQARNGYAPDLQRHHVSVEHGLSMACPREGGGRYIPEHFPPLSTVRRYFDDWSRYGVLARIHGALYVKCREQAERKASPTAAIIDSQSVKSAEKGGPRSTRMAEPAFGPAKGRTRWTRARRSKERSDIYLQIL